LFCVDTITKKSIRKEKGAKKLLGFLSVFYYSVKLSPFYRYEIADIKKMHLVDL
jgi:hypothetical protein